MLKKLKRSFVLINMTIITLMLFLVFGTITYFTQSNLREKNVQMMSEIAANPFRTTWSGDSDVSLPYFVVQITGGRIIVAVNDESYDLADGQPSFSYSTETLYLMIETVLESSEQTGMLRDYELRYYRADVTGMEYIVFADVSSEISTMNALIRNCVMIGIFAFFVFLGVSILLARWAVRPVDRAWQEQEQFVSDASHELKTPLTVIMTNAELLEDPAYSEEEKARFADSILAESKEMRSLVEDLLELARAENGAIRAGFHDLDFSVLISDALLPFEPLFYERGLMLHEEIEEGITVNGSASYLKKVADILLDNACKYAAEGSEVRVRLHRQSHGNCIFQVISEGQELSKEELENIFKRFYRTDAARSESGSYGLGLAIARSIVSEHKGKIWAESTNGLNTFSVQLPEKKKGQGGQTQ
ncbi:MAG: HAMP domain-containing histidine kinase [Lachnospiraceae bacterium]|nr:HAMP domain-containing histidine kinase [Lachnospiraceae bacterium]